MPTRPKVANLSERETKNTFSSNLKQIRVASVSRRAKPHSACVMAVVIAAPSFVFVSIFVTLTTARAPEQLHLSYGYSPNQMVVMWATKQDSKSRLHVRPRFIPSSDGVSKWTIVEAERWTFTNLEGNPNGLQTLHRVNLTVSTSLKPHVMHLDALTEFVLAGNVGVQTKRGHLSAARCVYCYSVTGRGLDQTMSGTYRSRFSEMCL
jgi:hypothetical protein